MSEQQSQRESEGQDRDDQDVESAAPADERKVVGENADVPAGEGEEANEAGVEGGEQTAEASGRESSEASRSGSTETGTEAHRDDDQGGGERAEDDRDDGQGGGERAEDDRDELAREIEDDPASNPSDPMLKEIKGG